MMSSLLADTQFSGRAGLLSWINKMCSAQYPSVVSLRDGAAYCSVVDATANRVAENCAAFGVPELTIYQKRAKRSSQLLARVSWGTTLATCANQDPSLDSIKERNQCERNMQTLQIMLYECLPPEFSLEIDVPRLACGKLQDHVQLLKRMHIIVGKLLTLFSKQSLELRIRSSSNFGCVEGVRITRAMMLHRKASQKYINDHSPSRLKREDAGIFGDTRGHLSLSTNQKSAPRCGNDNVMPVTPGRYTVLSKGQKGPPNSRGTHSAEGIELRSSLFSTAGSDGCGSLESRCSSTTGMSKPFFTVPQRYCHLLGDLRQEVESYEALVQASQGRHQRGLLAGECGSNDDAQMVERSGISTFHGDAPVVCLESLGTLSGKRDKLWQTLSVIHGTAAHRATELGVGGNGKASAPPLLGDILSALTLQ
ncbi:hypothetical protein, conserved [Trypanosoma brucei gambiense DAL972]|uniref:Calponin-homology (CH) domain-containing protein n=2 Tax=Trypanosoma brucei TaxID=5691 RepID=C9ZV68_TRYB9|nr:hypothetical protein, conserved [Trypanosoma brucei gambiense DAL972]RHW70749.1 hypothetical protein DPX39_080030700 [Trypanosoma brucei equiperdum]CBH13306.1 hypothetical protein, conserved [Trypanosoma brucei gambiense DAL972]|eukprot:XP_011775583.1 hypothetical protein, conserved [Trypanosoma brucei gambiense DAL972]